MYILEYGFGPPVSSVASGFCEDKLASPDEWFRRKYRHRRGRSGRSYVFSVYTPDACPAYEDAVLIVADARDRALLCVDMGGQPEARMSELRARFRERIEAVEFQVHVLAERPSDRATLIEDISRAPLDA
jgi:hypothetical protein